VSRAQKRPKKKKKKKKSRLEGNKVGEEVGEWAKSGGCAISGIAGVRMAGIEKLIVCVRS
jgi:hypothetical protein